MAVFTLFGNHPLPPKPQWQDADQSAGSHDVNQVEETVGQAVDHVDALKRGDSRERPDCGTAPLPHWKPLQEQPGWQEHHGSPGKETGASVISKVDDPHPIRGGPVSSLLIVNPITAPSPPPPNRFFERSFDKL